MKMTSQLCLVALVMCLVSTLAAPAGKGDGQASVRTGVSAETKDQQEDYLRRFYGLEPMPEGLGGLASALTDHEKAFQEAVKRLQHMAGLPETGEVDEETRKVMELPRCGVSDVHTEDASSRNKRYAAQGSKWGKNDLTYNILNFSPDMTQAEQESEIARALNVWTEHTPLKFTRVYSGQADIEVSFGTFDHGDPFPFDGEGGVLAHAFFPQFGGDAHMDDSETFSAFTFSGTNMFQVMAHEFGHSMGLEHSNVQSALMAPFYRGYVPNFKLDQDDIAGIQYLYGVKDTPTPSPTEASTRSTTQTTTTKSTTRSTTASTTTKSTTPSTTTKSTTPSTTTKSTTTSTTTRSTTPSTTTKSTTPSTTTKSTTPSTTTSSTPQPTTTRFTTPFTTTTTLSPSTTTRLASPDLCMDAQFDAITQCNGYTYAFRGSQYARLNNKGIDAGYPRDIASDWIVLPNDLDAALHLDTQYNYYYRNGRWYRYVTVPESTYFFKGSQVWRFGTDGPKTGYPKSISAEFPGLPNNIDAAFVWSGNQKIYVTKGSVYYRVTLGSGVDTGYPRYLSTWNGLPNKIDAAFQWTNGKTYFFNGPNYYRFNDQKYMVDRGYPRMINVWWLGCPGNVKADMTNEDKPDMSSEDKEPVNNDTKGHMITGPETMDSNIMKPGMLNAEDVTMATEDDAPTSGQFRLSSMSSMACLVILSLVKIAL